MDYLAVWRCWQMKLLGGLGQRPGVPDLVACIQGRYIAVEVKTGTATLSPRQQAERERIEASGGIYVLAHSVDDVEDRLLAEGLVRPALQRKIAR
jgi:hypothetical protein